MNAVVDETIGELSGIYFDKLEKDNWLRELYEHSEALAVEEE